MKPRYYVHMSPKAAERVSFIWKAAHITIFSIIVGASSFATACIYSILDMYDFHCITYAEVSFEKTLQERLQGEDSTKASFAPVDPNSTREPVTTNSSNETAPHESSLNLFRLNLLRIPVPGDNWSSTDSLKDFLQRLHRYNAFERQYPHLKNRAHKLRREGPNQPVNNTGFLNMRKTIFSTIYVCDLILFAPLASIIMAIFLGTLIAVGGKGGAGNPGDVLPNPWICIYPFLGLCAFMMIFNFTADNLFHKGLANFCQQYFPYTKTRACSELMDHFTVQFTENQMGEPQPFYLNYVIGSVGLQVTSAFWVVQTAVYMLRILCLADFSLYMTRIKRKEDEKGDPKMASLVAKLMESKPKVV